MRFRLSSVISVAGLLTAAVAVSVAAPLQAGAAVTTNLPLKQQVLTDATASLNAMAARSGDTDTQYLEQGRLRYQDVSCPRCELGPAVAAAAVYRRTADPAMLTLATTIFDAALRDQVKADGSFSNGAAGENDNLIQTVFYAEHLGSALTFFGPTLDEAHRTAYLTALTKAVDVMAARGLLSYYINGNVNLAATVAMGQAFKLTRSAKYQAYYEKSLAFTLRPGTAWAGFGLQTTKTGVLTLGRDTTAYLAEKGAGAPGFDPEYVHFQSEFAAQGFETIGDPRLLTLANQLNNALLPRVTTNDWTYDITGGSRKARTTGRDRFITPAYYVTALEGRSENRIAANAQVRALTDLIRASATSGWNSLYQSWGTTIATDIYAVN